MCATPLCLHVWHESYQPAAGQHSACLAGSCRLLSGLSWPYACTVAPNGDILFGEVPLKNVKRWSIATQTVTSLATGIDTVTGIALMVRCACARYNCMHIAVCMHGCVHVLALICSVQTQPNGDIIAVGQYSHQIFRVSADGQTKTVIAGTGDAGFSGDGVPAIAAKLNMPVGVAIKDGDIYFAELQVRHGAWCWDGSAGSVSYSSTVVTCELLILCFTEQCHPCGPWSRWQHPGKHSKLWSS